VARCHRAVLAYWKFESISLQRRVRCEPVSRENSSPCVEKPRFPAGVRAGANGAVDRDSQGPATSRRGALVSLSGDIPVPHCRRCGSRVSWRVRVRTCGQIIGYYSFVSVTLNVSKSRPARREAFERAPGALIPSASSGSPPRGMLLGGSAGIDRGACIPLSAAAGRPHHRPASVSTAAPDRRVRPKNRGPDQCAPVIFSAITVSER